MEIYIFYHNDCIFESAPHPMSLHKTKKGAFKAMNKCDWLDTFRVGVYEHWFVKAENVLEN